MVGFREVPRRGEITEAYAHGGKCVRIGEEDCTPGKACIAGFTARYGSKIVCGQECFPVLNARSGQLKRVFRSVSCVDDILHPYRR
jgi:hypothetical protein